MTRVNPLCVRLYRFAYVLVCLTASHTLISCKSNTSNPAVSPTTAASNTSNTSKSSEKAATSDAVLTDIDASLSQLSDCSIFVNFFKSNRTSAVFSVGKDWSYAILVPTDAAIKSAGDDVLSKFTSANQKEKVYLGYNHISMMGKRQQWVGGPNLTQTQIDLVNLKKIKFKNQVADVVKKITTPDGNQIFVINKPII